MEDSAESERVASHEPASIKRHPKYQAISKAPKPFHPKDGRRVCH